MNFLKPAKAVRAYRVEALNPEKGISSSLKVSKDQKEYIVCLFLPDRTKSIKFNNELSALNQLRKYRMLYKAFPSKK